MELKIRNTSSRILLERADNGVILYDLGEGDTVISKMLYEVYYRDGVIDFDNMAALLVDIIENLKIPISEPETNRAMEIYVVKIDPEKPAMGEEDFEDDDDDDNDDND
jgi:hypothetical protein